MNIQRKRTTRTLYQNAFKDTQNKPTLLEHTTSMLDTNTYQDTLQHHFPRTGLPGHTTKTHDQAALRRTHSKTRTTTLPTRTHSRGKPTFEPLRGTHDVNAVRGHTQRHARRNCIQEQTTTHQQFNLKVRRVLTPTWQSSYDPAVRAPQHNPDHPGYGRASAPHILTNALMRRGHSCPKMHHPPIGDIHLSLFLPYPNRPVARMSPA